MKKIIISDFDDTLYIKGSINKADIDKINDFRSNGNLFVIATGSSYTSFYKKLGKSNLQFDYLIVNHGSTIYKNDKIIFNEVIERRIIEDLIKRYSLENNYTLDTKKLGNFFSCAKEGLVKPNEKDITKVHIELDSNVIDKEIKYLTEKYRDMLNIYGRVFKNDIEIISNKASKIIAVKKILQLEGINDKDVYTIGDGESDLEMIRKYNGYAVKNCNDKLNQYCIKNVKCVSEMIDEILKNKK